MVNAFMRSGQNMKIENCEKVPKNKQIRLEPMVSGGFLEPVNTIDATFQYLR